ncbi:uncharacterized protein [Gossypium hirsutum]|uniref:Gag-pro-like protein n=1 Tax=Gossypium hirsutum TaxID=3635 RepID=A0A1U8HU73_GOSHI|nr:uncharacterized protein LOC107887790 [Gossypium hirsutum]
MAPLKPPYPKWYNPNASCMYHAGNQGHSTENCLAFKRRVQGFPYSADQPLVIYYDAKEQVKPKIIIEVPSPFPYKDNKAVTWKYDVNIIIPEHEKSKVMTGNVGEVGHFTRSGRCYSKAIEPMKKTNDLKQRGKAAMHEVEVEFETPSKQEVKRPVNEKEAHEFLKFIKHSEYNIMEQLSKQPAQISVLSLLLNSERYRNTLLKVLNQAYVASNISVEKLDRWVNNLNADNFISFSDDEIPPNGRGSVKSLHIITCCKGYIISNVLIDNGSALNVMPLAMLSRIPIDISYLRHCHSTVGAFDGTRREVMGKIKIPLEVGPYIYDIEFQVMDITPSYNCLLGRPWIHSARAVPSSLHQKVKFIMDGLLVTVVGEEDIIASISTDTPYLEVSNDTVECSFRSFEFINATFVVEGNKIPMPKLSRNTKMGIKLTVGKRARARKGLGRYQQWIVRALKPAPHKARYGLGFEPDMRQRRKQLQKDRERRIARALGRELEWEPITYDEHTRGTRGRGTRGRGRGRRVIRVESFASDTIPNLDTSETPVSPVTETGAESQDRAVGDDALSNGAEIFKGIAGVAPSLAEYWMKATERIMDDLDFSDE